MDDDDESLEIDDGSIEDGDGIPFIGDDDDVGQHVKDSHGKETTEDYEKETILKSTSDNALSLQSEKIIMKNINVNEDWREALAAVGQGFLSEMRNLLSAQTHTQDPTTSCVNSSNDNNSISNSNVAPTSASIALEERIEKAIADGIAHGVKYIERQSNKNSSDSVAISGLVTAPVVEQDEAEPTSPTVIKGGVVDSLDPPVRQLPPSAGGLLNVMGLGLGLGPVKSLGSFYSNKNDRSSGADDTGSSPVPLRTSNAPQDKPTRTTGHVDRWYDDGYTTRAMSADFAPHSPSRSPLRSSSRHSSPTKSPASKQGPGGHSGRTITAPYAIPLPLHSLRAGHKATSEALALTKIGVAIDDVFEPSRYTGSSVQFLSSAINTALASEMKSKTDNSDGFGDLSNDSNDSSSNDMSRLPWEPDSDIDCHTSDDVLMASATEGPTEKQEMSFDSYDPSEDEDYEAWAANVEK